MVFVLETNEWKQYSVDVMKKPAEKHNYKV